MEIGGDLTGAGQLVNSEVVKRAYDDALSPVMIQLGGLSEDTLKSIRLFTAPLQLLAAYQDRFKAFCERVRDKVPEAVQQDAPPEIARPVMEAFASTSDNGPLMKMYEELMAKAIDKRESGKLSPEFPGIIKGLSPFEALLLNDLRDKEQYTDSCINLKTSLISAYVGVNFDPAKYGDINHHLTLIQMLKEKNLLLLVEGAAVDLRSLYPNFKVPDGEVLQRLTIRLSMYGRWFTSCCSPTLSNPQK